jgi:hypothetical protein
LPECKTYGGTTWGRHNLAHKQAVFAADHSLALSPSAARQNGTNGVTPTRRIVLGGGSRSWKVLAPPSILLTLPDSAVVDGLAYPAPPRAES